MFIGFCKTLIRKLFSNNPALLLGLATSLVVSMVAFLYGLNFCNKVVQGNIDTEYVIAVDGKLGDELANVEKVGLKNCFSIELFCDGDIRILAKGVYSLSAGKPINGGGEIILGPDYKEHLGETIEMTEGGRRYKVVGIANDFYGFTLSAEGRNENFSVSSIKILAETGRVKEVGNILETIFDKSAITYPEPFKLKYVFTTPVFLYMLVLCLFSMLCIAVSLKYILSKNTEIMEVYSFVGVKRQTIAALGYLSIITAVSIAYIVSVVIYVILEAIWFKDGVFFGIPLSTNVSFAEYVLAYFILIVFYSLFLLPYIIKKSKSIAGGIENDRF